MLFTVSGISTSRPALSVISLVPASSGGCVTNAGLLLDGEGGGLEFPQAANKITIMAASKHTKHFFMLISPLSVAKPGDI
jgi:hypothetical protein